MPFRLSPEERADRVIWYRDYIHAGLQTLKNNSNNPAPPNKLNIENASVLQDIETNIVNEKLKHMNHDFTAIFRDAWEYKTPTKESEEQLLKEINRELYDSMYEDAGKSRKHIYPIYPTNQPMTKEMLRLGAENYVRINAKKEHDTVLEKIQTIRFENKSLSDAADIAMEMHERFSRKNSFSRTTEQVGTFISYMIDTCPFDHGNFETALAYTELCAKEHGVQLNLDSIRTMEPPVMDQVLAGKNIQLIIHQPLHNLIQNSIKDARKQLRPLHDSYIKTIKTIASSPTVSSPDLQANTPEDNPGKNNSKANSINPEDFITEEDRHYLKVLDDLIKSRQNPEHKAEENSIDYSNGPESNGPSFS